MLDVQYEFDVEDGDKLMIQLIQRCVADEVLTVVCWMCSLNLMWRMATN